MKFVLFLCNFYRPKTFIKAHKFILYTIKKSRLVLLTYNLTKSKRYQHLKFTYTHTHTHTRKVCQFYFVNLIIRLKTEIEMFGVVAPRGVYHNTLLLHICVCSLFVIYKHFIRKDRLMAKQLGREGTLGCLLH